MDACIFTMTINTMMAVYGADLTTQVDKLSVNDKVCVTRIENGWTEVHFNRGNIGHTGYLKGVAVQQNAAPTAPLPREEEYQIAPQAPAAPQQKEDFDSPQAPNPNFIVRPTGLVMLCQPSSGGASYAIAYKYGHAATFSHSGTTREYPVIREFDDRGHHVFYVTLQRSDQERAVFAAFDYSQRGEDVSTLATQLPGQPKMRDKCAMNWELSK